MYVCLFFFFFKYLFLFVFVLIYLVSVQWWCKKLSVTFDWCNLVEVSVWFSFVLALNFSVILNVQVLSSVCT